MTQTKEKNINKSEKGITLASLVILIILMVIISSVTITISLDRFKINNYKKMINDLELIADKVSNYYLEYDVLPILRDTSNVAVKYTYSTLDFNKNVNDNENYYILDLEAMSGLLLNYGKAGFENPNTTDDVYIINEGSHTIYYVKGIELDGEFYHYISKTTNELSDNIPPTKPEIKVISGTQNEEGIYTTQVELEFISGKDNWSGVDKTTYTVNGGTETDIATLENNIYPITESGTYEITLKTYDKTGNASTNTISVSVSIDTTT